METMARWIARNSFPRLGRQEAEAWLGARPRPQTLKGPKGIHCLSLDRDGPETGPGQAAGPGFLHGKDPQQAGLGEETENQHLWALGRVEPRFVGRGRGRLACGAGSSGQG